MTRDEILSAIRTANPSLRDLSLVDKLREYWAESSKDTGRIVDAALNSELAVVHASLAHLVAERASPAEVWISCRLAQSPHIDGQLSYTVLVAMYEQISHGAKPSPDELATIKSFVLKALESPLAIVCGTALELLLCIVQMLPNLINSDEGEAFLRRAAMFSEAVRRDWYAELDQLAVAFHRR
jgi:hypothetical protein